MNCLHLIGPMARPHPASANTPSQTKQAEPGHATAPTTTTEVAAAVITLFARIKSIEHSDRSWPSGHVVSELSDWFTSFGINTDADPATAAATLRLPTHLASALIAPHQRDGEFTIHLRTQHTAATDYVRSHLAALVWILAADTHATVFDHASNQISHITHPHTDSP